MRFLRKMSVMKRTEKGSILILALIFLAFVAVLIPTLVAFVNSGSRSGVMYDRQNSELYTADAGVQDAVEVLKNSYPLPSDPYTFTYNLNTKYGQDFNERLAQVTISTYIYDGIQYYKIFSQGQTLSGQETTITAYINAFDAYGWAHSKNAFTSPESLDFKSGNGGSIVGGAQLPQGRTGNGDIDVISNLPIEGWPSSEYFADYYATQVSSASSITTGVIDVAKNENVTQGAINQEGDLTIRAGGDGSLTLTDTWYIHNNLYIDRAGNNGTFNINLNGKAIFVEGSITQVTNSGNKIVQFNGPGVIISIGDIAFAPAAALDSDGNIDESKYIYILSIDGSVNIWPRGEFVGSVAARRASTIQPSTQLTFLGDPDFGSLNLPSSDITTHKIVIGDIESWIIDDPTGNSRIKISPYWLQDGEMGYNYPSQTLNASGGTSPYTWSLSSGTMPAGISLNSSSGVISGIPTDIGKFYFTVQAEDNRSPKKLIGKQVIVMTVNDLPSIISTSLPSGIIGAFYSEFINYQGGTPAFEWTVTSGSLPPGIDLIRSTGNLVGYPTAEGTYSFTLKLKDYYGAESTWLTSIVISPAP